MDDICDSVDTVEDARRQTKVKGWTLNKVLKEQSHREESSELRIFQGEFNWISLEC